MAPVFPTGDLNPRVETKASSFVSQFPDYDGRGITIGILDTGVDPGAIGLSRLPEGVIGDKKLVHVADCTGSGDVAMDTDAMAVQEEKGWVIKKGLFGKEIILNPALNLQPFPDIDTKANSDSDEEKKEDDEKKEEDSEDDKIKMPVRIAFKRAYELFPNKLTTRVKKHYAKEFDKEQHRHAVIVHRELAAWNAEYGGSKNITKEQLREKDDLTAKLDVLEMKNLPATDPLKEDPGALYQIILFYDGENYRVIIDTDGTDSTGDLSQLPADKAMTDYYKEYQYGTFSNVDMLNYAVNIYQEGKVVSIVCDAGAHGSHVAGIAARYHPDAEGEEETEANGVAPGAKLISLKIGDSRLGSMETGTAMTRAMIEAVKHKCDVINLSYGEGCVRPNSGRFVALAEQLVYKHGIVFVSSAGNNGPALTTVGAPGGNSECIIGVAAYVSPKMMEAQYSMRSKIDTEEHPGTTYTWSSVGPTSDGAQGVDITAPGAAITCVPNWCLQRNTLMNGTSMSSPNATGCIALLLSAAKAEGIKMTPTRLRRAIQNSAIEMPGLTCLQQGFGMINVEGAWDYIKNSKDDAHEDINFKVHIIGRPGSPRGIYLRQAQECATKQTFSAQVNPIFGNGDDVDVETQMKRVEFEMKFRLESDSDWVEVPDYFMLMHNGRSFKFDLDPTKLSTGVHTAKIYGYDSSKPGLGARFYVPITVVKPMGEQATIELGELEFEPNEVKRFFVDVPKDATWMDVSVKDTRDPDIDKETTSRLMVLHTLQLLPHMAYRDAEEQKYFNLLPGQETVTSIPVHAGITCELDIGRYWSAQGKSNVEVDVRFRGVVPVPNELTMLSGKGGVKARLHSNIYDEYILPKAKLSNWKSPLGPTSAVISPCDERDILTSNNQQVHQLVLTYEFENKEAGSITPRCPALQGVIYESAFESQMMLIFDEDKKYLGVADSWPSAVKIPKGKITIRMQVRHNNVKKLEKLKDLSIWIERKLSKEITLPAFKSRASMVTEGIKAKRSLLRKGSNTAVFFGEPAAADIPSEAKCGDILMGSATFEDGEASLPGAGKQPGGTSIHYVVGTKTKEEKEKAKTPEAPDERSVEEKMEEAIKKVKVEHLEKLSEKEDDAEKFISLSEKLSEEYPGYLPLLMASLKFYDKKDSRSDKLSEVTNAADAVIDAIDENALAAHFGVKHDEEDAEICKIRKDYEEKKSFLIEALARKARAVADDDTKDQSTFDTIFKHLQKWTDTDAKKFAVLSLEKQKNAKRYGSMLKLLTTLLENDGKDTKDGICPMTKKDLLEKRKEVLETLNYTHLQQRDAKWGVIASIKNFALF
eukprot:CAMPEP_0194110042 /NCGR_PEP_ID=MMETSP0150-20130528/9376_1 /TAXON_ID=122233 /ORGANISM="Chaetoceros debilis, Strain MM31A-1" /LENGTH=1321 /DNA_ID=CAMNT_0038799113 /DNA_START=77 /DNA_END=4042 /DNA_ORIENTATION=-